MSRARIVIVSLIVFMAFFMLVTQRVAADLRTNIKISMQLAKQDFKPGEPVKGGVLFDNRTAAVTRSVFIIRIYFEKELFKQVYTAIPVIFPGKNRYTFEELGCSFLNRGLQEAGIWRLEVVQQDVDEEAFAATQTFQIIEEGKRP